MVTDRGCGLGLDISVSRHTNVSVLSREKLSASRLGLGQLHLVPKTNFRPNCTGHINKTYACERALDVVNLCCSYYFSSY